MATLLPNGKQQFLDPNGNPLAGGSVYFYVPGTTTPQDTWQDAAQTTLNTNPVVLDAYGQAVIYGSGAYRQIVKDASGNLIWDQVTQDVSGLTVGIAQGGTGGTTGAPLLIASVAALRALAGAALPVLYLRGWATDGDGGEGFFRYDASDTTSPDNGGTVLVDAAGHRYKRALGGQMATPRMFGAKGDARTVTDGAISLAAPTTLTSNSAAFTAADLGKAVSVLGAGAGGATLATTIAGVTGGTTAVLAAAAATAVTGAGVSLGSDDTAALQAWLGWLCHAPQPETGHAGYWTTGRYKITAGLVYNDGLYLPNLFTDGADFVQLDGWSVIGGTLVTIYGGLAAGANAEWQGMTIDAGTVANGTDGVRVTGIGWWVWKNVKPQNCANALRLYNNTANPFTEGFVAEHWDFGGSNTTWLRYTNDTGGTHSFRSSGLRHCLGNPGASSPIVVEAGATPYMAPMDFTCWPAAPVTLIANDPSNNNWSVSFEGSITIEANSNATVVGSGPNFTMRGSGIHPTGTSATTVTLGSCYTCRNIAPGIPADAEFDPVRTSGTTTTTGQAITISVLVDDPYTGQTAFVSIGLNGNNWSWSALVALNGSADGATLSESVLNSYLFNGAGYGAPTVSVSGTTLTIAQPATVPAGTVYTVTQSRIYAAMSH